MKKTPKKMLKHLSLRNLNKVKTKVKTESGRGKILPKKKSCLGHKSLVIVYKINKNNVLFNPSSIFNGSVSDIVCYSFATCFHIFITITTEGKILHS